MTRETPRSRFTASGNPLRLAASKLSLTSLGATTCAGYGRITTHDLGTPGRLQY
ncbi:hypothetical protein EXIGLDRAFT_730190, partial [Exidia glandulosa HHB12029]